MDGDVGKIVFNGRRLLRMNKWKDKRCDHRMAYLKFFILQVEEFWVMAKSRMVIGEGAEGGECHWTYGVQGTESQALAGVNS